MKNSKKPAPKKVAKVVKATKKTVAKKPTAKKTALKYSTKKPTAKKAIESLKIVMDIEDTKTPPGTKPTGAPPTSSAPQQKVVVGIPEDLHTGAESVHGTMVNHLQSKELQQKVNESAAREQAISKATQEKTKATNRPQMFSDLSEIEQAKKLFQSFPADEVGKVVGKVDPRDPYQALKPQEAKTKG